MRFRLFGIFPILTAIATAIVSLHGSAQAQLTVTLNPVPGPTPFATTMTAPTGQFTLEATVSGFSSSTTIDKVVFYRNDVAYEVDTVPAYQLIQSKLGQDNYTYRARAFASNGEVADSNDLKVTVNTPGAVMIDPLPATEDLGPVLTAKIESLGKDGGTVFFRCNNSGTVKFVIKSTVPIPSNITLQGESSLDAGRCQIWWANASTPDVEGCQSGGPARSEFDHPMFRVLGDAERVRFKDLHLRSMTNGLRCHPRTDMSNIANEKTTAIEIGGNASDIIIENVSIAYFTQGIRAYSTGEDGIRNVRIRGVRSLLNHRQLFVQADYAYDWDVQNLNITGMASMQGGVEIVKAGRPESYDLNSSMKFLQLNCNGNPERQGFCMKIRKHGGLYIKQMHHEGISHGLEVENISADDAPNNSNTDPIVLEGGVGSGVFEDPSMKLYTIGNNMFASPLIWPATHDDTTMQFNGDGADADLYDCGDIHWDWTDTMNPDDPDDPPENLHWADLRMAFTHSERNRGSFFVDNHGYAYVKEHKPCQADIKNYGGEHFDTGVLPTEVYYTDLVPYPAYSRILNTDTCGVPCTATAVANWFQNNLPLNGTIYIDGNFDVGTTINVPKGKQIFGAPNASLRLITPGIELFKIDIPPDAADGRVSAIVIRNLRLVNGTSSPGSTTGIRMVGTSSATAGTSSDMHFSGLRIEGFGAGLTAKPFVYPSPTPTVSPTPPTPGHPMMDGVSWKDMTFVNNSTAVEVTSANTSNWNVMDLNISSNTVGAVGWYQRASGNSIQNVSCAGTTAEPMAECIKLEFASTYLTGFKRTTNVTNGLTIGLSPEMWGGSIYFSRQMSVLLLRGNDFRGSDVDIDGKSFLLSMNNKYADINITGGSDGTRSRVTKCGDDYGSGPGFSDLVDDDMNRYLGVEVPTEVDCGGTPYKWETPIMFAEESSFGSAIGSPFAANFFGDPSDDYVVFKRIGSQGYFYIQERNGTRSDIYDFGTTGDIPLVGHITPDSPIAQLVIFRPGSPSTWWVKETENNTGTVLATFGNSSDRPFVGNFLSQTGVDDKDEIAIYRESDGYIWITNPYTSDTISFPTGVSGTNAANQVIQVANFLGRTDGHQQIALYNKTTGEWKLYDPLNLLSLPVGIDSGVSNFTSDDVPVAAQYWSGNCAQIAVWRPSTQKFVVQEPNFSTCGSRGESELLWGSNNFDSSSNSDDDIPLTMSFENGVRKPTAYRPFQGSFPYGIAKGLWLVHDPVPEP